MTKLIKYAHSLMEVEGQSSEPVRRTISTVVGNYGRHMAFATDPPFCTAYPLSLVHKDDPAQMTQESAESSRFLHGRWSISASVARVGLSTA